MCKSYPRVFVAFLLILACCCTRPLAGDTTILDGLDREPISLKDYRQRVLERNEAVQISLLELEATRQRRIGERGIFEPEAVASFEHLDSKRPNTVEQQRQQFTSQFNQQNNLYNLGLESLIPGGARVHLGYSLSDLHNNLQQSSITGGTRTNAAEWLTFVGLNLTQPLLKNGGWAVSMASLRLAAVSSDVAFQEYRRRLMETVATAESLYWQLFFAQEQLGFYMESVAVAEALLQNNRERLDVGTGSELEVMEAESGLALRRSRQDEAAQKLVEISNALISLYSSTVIQTNLLLQATDRPEAGVVSDDLFDSWRKAQTLNPDYLGQRRRVAGEMIRQGFARNQRLPQLDLKGSVGYYGLSETASGSMADVNTGDYPAFSLGVEMRLPLGGSRARGEYRAAQLRRKQAELALEDIETQMINGMDTAMRKVRNTAQNMENYAKVAEFYQNLFDTQEARLELGAIDSQTLLRTEEQLFEAKNSVIESLVLHQRSVLELELAKGEILANRNLELLKEDLEQQTARLFDEGVPEGERLDWFRRGMRAELRQRAPDYQPDTPTQQHAREALRTYEEEARQQALEEERQEEIRRRTPKPDPVPMEGPVYYPPPPPVFPWIW